MAVQVRHVTVHKTGTWYVVNTSPPSGSPTVYTVMEGTQSDADNLPNGGGVSGPYSSLAAADNVAAHEPGNSTQPTPFPGLSVSPGGGLGVTNPLNAIPGLQQVGTFFSDLSQASTWIRVAEVLAGLILIAVGIARITHAVPIATKVAKAVGTKGL